MGSLRTNSVAGGTFRIHSGRRTRERRVLVGLLGILAIVCTASLTLGGYPMSPSAVVGALVGSGSSLESFVVNEVRLPRMLLAVMVGTALALSGAMLQALLDNPLASPDIIGISQGAAVGAVWALLVVGLGAGSVMLAALVGAGFAATLIYVLAWRAGITGQRFVLIGVGVAFMAHGALGYMLTRGDVREVQGALSWMVGSVASARWDHIALLGFALAILVPVALASESTLRALQLGEVSSRALGVSTNRARAAVIATAVALAAVATAVAGPVAFVAFLGGPVARRLLLSGRPALLAAALIGALIVAGADLIGRHMLPGDVQVPVGVITGAIGAPYLLWLLANSGRGQRA